MSYVEDSVAIFQRHAGILYNECANAYKEKETAYLKGTHFLKLRVLNRMAEILSQEMRLQMDERLDQCKTESPSDLPELEKKLKVIYSQYVTRFRQQYFGISNAN